jgi:methionyl-tRNA synthetase
MVENFYPEYDGSGDTPAAVSEILQPVPNQIEELAFDKALQSMWQALTHADELIEKNRPWELVKAGKTNEAHAVLQQLFQTIKAANVYLAPFLPDTHQKITSLLGARPLKKPATPLFPRLA